MNLQPWQLSASAFYLYLWYVNNLKFSDKYPITALLKYINTCLLLQTIKQIKIFILYSGNDLKCTFSYQWALKQYFVPKLRFHKINIYLGCWIINAWTRWTIHFYFKTFIQFFDSIYTLLLNYKICLSHFISTSVIWNKHFILFFQSSMSLS